MKKILLTTLISLLLILPVPAFAEPNDIVNVEVLTFDQIEEYMITYNAQIYANNMALSDIQVPGGATKASLQQMITVLEEKIQGYSDKIIELEGLSDEHSEYLIDIYTSLIEISTGNKISLESQLESFDANRERASEAQTRAAVQTEAGNMKIIWGAQQLFINYNSLDHQIKQQHNRFYLLQKQLEIMNLRQQLGLIVPSNYKSLETNYKILNNAIKAMVDQQRFLKEQLNIMLNQNHEFNLKITPTPEPESEFIQQMNFEEDYGVAKNLSLNVIANMNSYESEAEERKFKLNFKQSYDNVANKQEILELEQYKLDNQKELYDQAKLKSQLGLISKITFEEQQIAFEDQSLQVKIAKDELFKAYEQYEWSKRGLSF